MRKPSVYPRDFVAAERRLIAPASAAGTRVVIGFPSRYEVAMSNLGFQHVFRLLSERSDAQVLRAFAGSGRPPRILEDGRPLGSARILAWSLSYEADYLEMIRFLSEAGIPLEASGRGERDPFILLGGIAVTANPLPLGPLADAVVLGECEDVLSDLVSQLIGGVEARKTRADILKEIADLPGVFVPSIHEAKPVEALHRVETTDIDRWPTHSAILTPHTVFADTFLLEVSRGCRRGCRFCLTGALHPRLRVRSVESLVETVDRYRPAVRRMGLIGAELTSHPGLGSFLEALLSRGLSATLSSLEVDQLTPELVHLIARAGTKTLTIAPESGDEIARRALGKRFSNETVISAARSAAASSVRQLKVYFLIGTPETSIPNEAESLVALSKEIAGAFLDPPSVEGVARRVSVAVSPWVPKPLTPWAKIGKMAPAGKLKSGLARVKKGLAGAKAVEVVSPSFSAARLDARISNGDAETFEWLVKKALG